MDIDLSDVELDFVANLKTLRRVFSTLSKNGRRWWIASDPRDAIQMGGILGGHGDPLCRDRLNSVLFNLPVLNDEIPRAGVDSLVFLLDPTTISTTNPGYYLECGRVEQESIADFKAFYQPIRAARVDVPFVDRRNGFPTGVGALTQVIDEDEHTWPPQSNRPDRRLRLAGRRAAQKRQVSASAALFSLQRMIKVLYRTIFDVWCSDPSNAISNGVPASANIKR
jgi:hypothetical protein